MKRFTSKNQITGELGEKICVEFLEKNDFRVLEQNYTVATGEIDIIAKKNDIIHFIEVKSIKQQNTHIVSHETLKYQTNGYNPAQNMTPAKIIKCSRAIHQYKLEKSVSCETQLDLYCVFIDTNNIKHFIERIENIY